MSLCCKTCIIMCMILVPAATIIINTTANIGHSAALYCSKSTPTRKACYESNWACDSDNYINYYNFCKRLSIETVSWMKDGVLLNNLNVPAKYDIKYTKRIAEKTNLTALLMGPENLQSRSCCTSDFTSILTVNNVTEADYGTYTCNLGYARNCQDSVGPTATPTYRTRPYNRRPQDKAMCNPGGIIAPPSNGSEKTTEVIFHKRVDVAGFYSDSDCHPKVVMFYCIGRGDISWFVSVRNTTTRLDKANIWLPNHTITTMRGAYTETILQAQDLFLEGANFSCGADMETAKAAGRVEAMELKIHGWYVINSFYDFRTGDEVEDYLPAAVISIGILFGVAVCFAFVRAGLCKVGMDVLCSLCCNMLARAIHAQSHQRYAGVRYTPVPVTQECVEDSALEDGPGPDTQECVEDSALQDSCSTASLILEA